MTNSLILFGATGDLAQRMLLPSLYGLDADDLLPARLRIVSTARSNLTEAAFLEFAAAALTRFVEPAALKSECVSRLLQRLRFVCVDAQEIS